MAIDVAALPFDAWFSISIWLSIRDICIVQQVCKTIHDTLDSPSVWLVVYQDLVQLQCILSPLCGSSASEPNLKQSCVRLAQMYAAWGAEELVPNLVYEGEIDHTVNRLAFLPGGEHIAAANNTCPLLLLSGTNQGSVSQQYIYTPSASEPGHFSYLAANDLQTYATSSTTAYVTVCQATFSRNDGLKRLIHVYHYNGAGINFVTTLSLPHADEIFHKDINYDEGTLWMARLRRSGHGLCQLTVLSLGTDPGVQVDHAEVSTHLDIRYENVQFIRLVSNTRLLIFFSSAFSMYDLSAASDMSGLQGSPRGISATLLWTSERPSAPDGVLAVGRLVRYETLTGGVHRTRCAVWHENYQVDVLDMPCACEGPEDIQISLLQLRDPDPSGGGVIVPRIVSNDIRWRLWADFAITLKHHGISPNRTRSGSSCRVYAHNLVRAHQAWTLNAKLFEVRLGVDSSRTAAGCAKFDISDYPIDYTADENSGRVASLTRRSRPAGDVVCVRVYETYHVYDKSRSS